MTLPRSRDEPATRGAIPSSFSLRHRLGRAAWGLTYAVLFRPSPRPLHGWRRALLRLFGAELAPSAKVYPRARVWAPWNLCMHRHACIADDVDCYCVERIEIGACATVSQYTYLCGATHDYTDPHMKLLPKPIVIGPRAWVCADVFIGPGVSVGEGAVVGARSTVFRDVDPWSVVVGSPPRYIRERTIREADDA